MDFFSILRMLGGLALFLYGMKTMGEELSKLAGGKLGQILEHMTNNPIKAVLLGAGVTAVMQSSSATTVMVVGFVNSRIMKLSQAVGVIMGANIGTTVTSWLLSLTGIESGNFFLKLLKPSSFSPVLAFLGVILLMFTKSEKKKDIGNILLGFSVLMFGMETMSSAVKPLAEVSEFTALFTAFENPILGMLAGAVLTAVIQSSSASVGILQAICATGSVSVGAALPVIMGQNIGTCVTTLISGVGASKNAKRAAMIHLYFNLIGTILFMLVFYGLNTFFHFSFLFHPANGAIVAVIHSVFNIAATLLLLPASKLIEKLAYATLPKTADEEADRETKLLDERFLERPAFAVAQCKSAVCDTAKLVEEAMGLCKVAVNRYTPSAAERIMTIEEEVDNRQDELGAYLAKLSAKPLSERDSRSVIQFERSITDFERISDYAKGIAYTLQKLEKSEEHFSEKAWAEVRLIFDAALEIVENTVRCFVHDDMDMAVRIDPLSDVVSSLKKEIRKNHNIRLAQGKCSVGLGMALTDMVTSLERIARHCSNIAEQAIATETDTYAFHQYIRARREKNEWYKKCQADYRRKFALVSGEKA